MPAPEPPIAMLSSVLTSPSTRLKLSKVGSDGSSLAESVNSSVECIIAVLMTTQTGISVTTSIVIRMAQASRRPGARAEERCIPGTLVEVVDMRLPPQARSFSLARITRIWNTV